jgi:hypothetical protein
MNFKGLLCVATDSLAHPCLSNGSVTVPLKKYKHRLTVEGEGVPVIELTGVDEEILCQRNQ